MNLLSDLYRTMTTTLPEPRSPRPRFGRSGGHRLRLPHDDALPTLAGAPRLRPQNPSGSEMIRRLSVLTMLWCCACGDEVVQLYKSRRYEPISCSPNGFTVEDVGAAYFDGDQDAIRKITNVWEGS